VGRACGGEDHRRRHVRGGGGLTAQVSSYPAASTLPPMVVYIRRIKRGVPSRGRLWRRLCPPLPAHPAIWCSCVCVCVCVCVCGVPQLLPLHAYALLQHRGESAIHPPGHPHYPLTHLLPPPNPPPPSGHNRVPLHHGAYPPGQPPGGLLRGQLRGDLPPQQHRQGMQATLCVCGGGGM
jgi:hypothetical protein